jgi:hypothetical protein
MRSWSLWPTTLQHWLAGLILSAPLALLLLLTRAAEPEVRAIAASLAVLLSIPWVIPVTVLVAVCSVPLYMWLHTQGPVPQVLDWLGGIVLVAAVVGCHINGALLAAWRRARLSAVVQTGLRNFLIDRRSQREHGQGHRFH